MTDLITRARKEWCHLEQLEGVKGPDGAWYRVQNYCPPEVVAALLDVLMDAYQGVDPFDGKATSGHSAVAIITRALEGV